LRTCGRIQLLAGRPRTEIAAPLILIALAVGVWLPRLRGPIDLRWDAGVYYTLGTSLAENKGYRLLNEPGEIKATQYPPLLPALITAHQLILGTSDPTVVGQALRLSFLLLFVGYIAAVYILARDYLPVEHSFGVTLVCLFNFYTSFLSDSCFPEIAFALATVMLLVAHLRGGRYSSFLAALCAVAAYALRTVGVCLLAAWAVEGLLKRQYTRALLRLALLVVVVAGWQLYIHSVETEPTYRRPAYAYQRADYLFYNVSYSRNISLRDPFRAESGRVSITDALERSWENMRQLPIRLGVAVTSDRYFWDAQRIAANRALGVLLVPEWVIDATLIALASLILVGLGLQVARAQWIIPLYLAFSFVSLSLTPWPEQFTRYFAPLAPFLALSLFLGLRTLPAVFGRLRPHLRRVIGMVVTGLVVSVILVEDGLTFVMMYRGMHQHVTYVDQSGQRVSYRLFFYKDAYRALDAGLDWLRQRANPADVVAASMPHWVYLRTGLKAIMPPFETDPVRTQELLDSVPVAFIVQDRGLDLDTRKYLDPVIRTFPERWRLVYRESIEDASRKHPQEAFEIFQRVHP
jgi:hypothetical protein